MSDTLTVSEGVRLVTETQAARELLAIGFTKAKCEPCEGIGYFATKPDEQLFQGVSKAKYGRMCECCAGHGWNWRRPDPNRNTPTPLQHSYP